MDGNRLVSEFVDAISERAEADFRGRLHQAFVAWYIEAEFGRVKWDFTDDARDGGVDAVVWRPDDSPPIVLIQSKFAEQIGRTPLASAAYAAFRGVVEAFYKREEAFDDWLRGVRDDLRRIYRKAFGCLSGVNNWNIEKKAFRLVTTCKRRAGAEFPRIPREAFVYCDDVLGLYEQYRKGWTPQAHPLSLKIEDKLSYKDRRRGVTSYLFNARLSDLRDYLEANDVSRLVARNIRYNLAGSVGRAIRKTFESDPNNFWYVHNGLTIICDELVEKDQVATLVNPSVVNGAQTLYAISGSARKNSPALVTTRVIVRGCGDGAPRSRDHDEWLQTVIRGVNTQNRVRAHDFRSNEPEQIELQNRFRDVRVFYERKRGEWREFRNEPRYRGFEQVSLVELGQILAVVSEKDGKGVLLVKRGLEHTFDDRHYATLFPPRPKIGRRFERIYLAYRLYRLLRRLAYRTSKEQRRQRHAFWNTLWLAHLGITSVPRLYSQASVPSIKTAFDRFEGNAALGRRAKKILKQCRKAVWSAWRAARTVDPEQWTANNFFKSKFGNRHVLRSAWPRVKAGLQALGRELAAR